MITIIIPTYKPQRYIDECLYSLEAQTLDKSQFEVLVILNGEREPYYSYIRRLLDSYTFKSHLYFSEVPGVSNARNIGLDNAAGDYIGFIDDDDYVSPDYLAELLEKSSPDTISLCYPYAFIDGGTAQEVYSITKCYNKLAPKGKQRFSYGARRYFNGPWMKLIPMSFIRERRFDPHFKNGEDALFMFLISDKFKHIDFTSDKAIYYRRYRDNSAMTSKKAVSYIVKNNLRLLMTYSAIYFSAPTAYSFTFYFNRLLATIKYLIIQLIIPGHRP